MIQIYVVVFRHILFTTFFVSDKKKRILHKTEAWIRIGLYLNNKTDRFNCQTLPPALAWVPAREISEFDSQPAWTVSFQTKTAFDLLFWRWFLPRQLLICFSDDGFFRKFKSMFAELFKSFFWYSQTLSVVCLLIDLQANSVPPATQILNVLC